MRTTLVKGDRIFYCSNSAAPQGFSSTAFRVIRSLGLVPITFSGLGSKTRRSNVDREARDGLYSSKLWILLLTAKKKVPITDSWLLPELDQRGNRMLLLYAIGTIAARRELPKLSLPVSVVFVSDERQFAIDLRERIEALLSSAGT